MTDKINAQLVSAMFLAQGWSRVVVSPGSRNAPLIKAFQSYSEAKLYSIVDERCAAFFALGLAQASGEPVALVCTSGTALLNYAPAIAEAYYQGVPLVVLSADRPKHRINTGEGQSIDQQNVYANYQKGYAVLEEEENWQLKQAELVELFHLTISGKVGPIHVNLHFEEPLYNKGTSRFNLADLEHNPSMKASLLDDRFLSSWKNSSKRMILCGILPKTSFIADALRSLHNEGKAVVLFESTSNLPNDCGIGNIDRVISAMQEGEEAEPTLLITLGEHVISKRIKQMLRGVQLDHHWHINSGGVDQDTFDQLTATLSLSPEEVLGNLLDCSPSIEEYYNTWHQAASNAANSHKDFVNDLEYSDLQVFDHLLANIPTGYHLQCANSSVVRYVQLFNYNHWLSCHANRGTSGIDGSTSTAIGYAAVVEEPVVFLSGDISFLYDSNALWNRYVPSNFRVIVINNGGGGIFRFIPGPTSVENFETYFETEHQVDIKSLCASYGWKLDRAHDLESLKLQLESFYDASEVPKVLEVITPTEVNPEVLKAYFRFIQTRNS